jgi:DNA-binding beta-propeller fold protein YncE
LTFASLDLSSAGYGAETAMGSQRHKAARIAAATAVALVAVAAVSASPAAAATERIFSVAGAGFFERSNVAIAPPTGDGGPAAFARLTSPVAVAATPDGGFLIAEATRQRIRRVSPRGVITTVAGTGRGGLSGDGGPATVARINTPVGVAQLADGTVAFADQRNNRVALVDPAGVISTLAAMIAPDGVAAAADGGVLVVQDFENRVLHVGRAGVVTTVAGSGIRGFLVASVNQIRRVRPDGTVATLAGTGRGNFSGDGGPARSANTWLPRGVAAAAGGGVFVAEPNAEKIRFIDSADPGPAPGVTTPRFMAASFARGIQRGGVSNMTRIRVACPPRLVAVRFALARAATVSVVVTRSGKTVARPGARLGAGAAVLRFRVNRTGEHLVQLTAVDSLRRAAHDQAQLSVNSC